MLSPLDLLPLKRTSLFAMFSFWEEKYKFDPSSFPEILILLLIQNCFLLFRFHIKSVFGFWTISRASKNYKILVFLTFNIFQREVFIEICNKAKIKSEQSFRFLLTSKQFINVFSIFWVHSNTINDKFFGIIGNFLVFNFFMNDSFFKQVWLFCAIPSFKNVFFLHLKVNGFYPHEQFPSQHFVHHTAQRPNINQKIIFFIRISILKIKKIKIIKKSTKNLLQ